ncbi:MAG: hypothetical protein K2Q45_05285 [Nitrosomonas sp.]|nr:hypothetical protein [Nitrosomonas sp.]
MNTLQPLLHEISRLKFNPGALLFKACERISSLLPDFEKEFDLNVPTTVPQKNDTNQILVWLEAVKQSVHKAYDRYRIRIQDDTLLAIAMCEAQNDEQQKRIGLSLLFSFAYIQQSPSYDNIINFAKRFVKLIRAIDVSQTNVKKSFLFQQFDFKFENSFEQELEWFCDSLEKFPEITIQPWQAAMMNASFLMAKTFAPIIGSWREMVLDIAGKIESEPIEFSNTIIETVSNIQRSFEHQEQDSVESDLQMTIGAIFQLQNDVEPSNMPELLEMFKRRTGYDVLSLFTILDVSKNINANKVEIVEARAREIIVEEKNTRQKEFDLYEKALRSFEVQKISDDYLDDYSLFKEAAQLHFKQNAKTWKEDMQLFELELSEAEKLQLFGLYEKFFAAAQKLDELQDELNGILTKNKRTLKRIQADKAKANTHALLAETSLKRQMQMTGLSLDDDDVKQIMFLLLDKKIRLQNLDQTLTNDFKKLNKDAFKLIRGHLRLYFDAVDTIKFFELEEENHLRSKNFWKIILTVLFFFLWGALIYFTPYILLGITDTLFGTVTEEGPNPEWILSNATTVQNVTNATAEVLQNVTQETGILSNVIGTTSSIFNNVLSWGTSKVSKIYIRGFKKGRLDTLLQDTGFTGFDYSRLNPREFSKVVLKGQFGSMWIVLGYYWVIYRLMKSVLPMWIGFSISSARLVVETYFEDNFIDSLTMESAILASNFGIMKAELIMASTSFCVQIMDRGRNLSNLVTQVGTFVAMGKAGVVPAVYTIANANSNMPDEMKMYIEASQKKEPGNLWITQQDVIRKGGEMLVEWKKEKLDPLVLEEAAKKPAENLRIEFPERAQRIDSESSKELQISVISDDEEEE